MSCTSVAQGYYSILFKGPDDRVRDDVPEVPAFFRDLNCDQIVDAVTAGKEEYDLKPFFHHCLHRIDAINYRQDVMRDLENPTLVKQVRSFSSLMRNMRERLVKIEKIYCKEHKQARFLSTIQAYCDGIKSLATHLSAMDLQSRGFIGFRAYLKDYVSSDGFIELVTEAAKRKAELSTVKYCVLIHGDKCTVLRYEEEGDYSADVEETFQKFKLGAVKDYRVTFAEKEDINHVEAKILELVGKLHPEVFGPLDEYCAKHAHYIDDKVATFDREIQFYLACIDYIAPLKGAGLQFCYPRVSDSSKSVRGNDAFDIALANKLVNANSPVVCNDFYLEGNERILVISGPNQGGKTTMARLFGQMHYLASIGCPVPGSSAELFLFDKLLTHFEREEKVDTLRGKLEDDLLRIHDILTQATPRSIVVMNEIFTSTTIHDETFLSRKVMEIIASRDLVCVWVTFVDELASYGPQTVSMVSTVVPEDPAVRTFKVLRRPADGLAYAKAIAEKYRLTYGSIMERTKP
jgi:DNA mismatch repair ATPase MutS